MTSSTQRRCQRVGVPSRRSATTFSLGSQWRQHRGSFSSPRLLEHCSMENVRRGVENNNELMRIRNIDVEDADEENDDNNNDEEPQPDDRHRLIESYEHFLERHGIADVLYGSQSERNLEERRSKFQEESDYQEDIHRTIFGADQPQEENSERAQFLATIKDEVIDIETSKEVIRDVPLKSMAELCDTLFTLATFKQAHQSEKGKRLSFSLKSFQHEAVVEFVAIMLGDKGPEEVSADHVVECCEIARYMQCERVLEAMVDILMSSIDNANCMALCQLADQLDLPRLFEKSMAQMMQSLGSLQQHELWNDFNPELKSRIVDMEAVMRSSIHNVKNRLYFSSMEEYLSIFAENVEYYRERLAEAKERQAEELPVGHAWTDAQSKIDKQVTRMRTLELVLKEQKELFGRGRQQKRHLDRRL